MDKKFIEDWLNESHTRTVYSFSVEFNMDISEVWRLLDGEGK